MRRNNPKEPVTVWSILRFFIMAGVIASMIGLVTLMGISFIFGNMLCGAQEVDQELLSPDGKYKLLVYGYECGGDTAFTSDVALLPAWKPNVWQPGNLMVQDGRPEWNNLEVSWVDDDTILIRFDPAQKLELNRETYWFLWRKFTVQYEPLGE